MVCFFQNLSNEAVIYPVDSVIWTVRFNSSDQQHRLFTASLFSARKRKCEPSKCKGHGGGGGGGVCKQSKQEEMDRL